MKQAQLDDAAMAAAQGGSVRSREGRVEAPGASMCDHAFRLECISDIMPPLLCFSAQASWEPANSADHKKTEL